MDRLEREFQKHKAWIARCEDVQALLDRMVGYRRDLQAGVHRGDALLRMRASDLLEIAEDRIVELKGREMAARRVAALVPPLPAESAEAAEIRRLREELGERDQREAAHQAGGEAQRRAAREALIAEQRAREAREKEVREAQERERARRFAEDERLAATRLANAQAAEVEARTALIRARAQEAQRARVVEPARPVKVAAPVVPAARSAVMTPSPRPLARPTRPVVSERKMSKKPSPPPVSLATTTASSVSVDALPAYTGRDLADYRLGHGLTQRAIAAMLGVEQGTVCKGERRPGAVLGPTLRAAFYRLMAGGRA